MSDFESTCYQSMLKVVQLQRRRRRFQCRNSWERWVVHQMAEKMGLRHEAGVHPTEKQTKIHSRIWDYNWRGPLFKYSKHVEPVKYIDVWFDRSVYRKFLQPSFPDHYLPELIGIVGQYVEIGVETSGNAKKSVLL